MDNRGTDTARLDRVETEVSTVRSEMVGIKTEMSGLKADVRGLGSVLQRIEKGVGEAQQRFDDDKVASRINPIAMGTVLLTIISILVGGAWLVSGQLARQDERSFYQQRSIDAMERTIFWADRDRGVRDDVAREETR